jgi:hypothetical protein
LSGAGRARDRRKRMTRQQIALLVGVAAGAAFAAILTALMIHLLA